MKALRFNKDDLCQKVKKTYNTLSKAGQCKQMGIPDKVEGLLSQYPQKSGSMQALVDVLRELGVVSDESQYPQKSGSMQGLHYSMNSRILWEEVAIPSKKRVNARNLKHTTINIQRVAIPSKKRVNASVQKTVAILQKTRKCRNTLKKAGQCKNNKFVGGTEMNIVAIPSKKRVNARALRKPLIKAIFKKSSSLFPYTN